MNFFCSNTNIYKFYVFDTLIQCVYASRFKFEMLNPISHYTMIVYNMKI